MLRVTLENDRIVNIPDMDEDSIPGYMGCEFYDIVSVKKIADTVNKKSPKIDQYTGRRKRSLAEIQRISSGIFDR